MDFSFLKDTKIFFDLNEKEINSIFETLGYTIKKYPKGDVIYYAGQHVDSMGIVLSGSVTIESNDVWGNKSIFDNVKKGQVFAEVYACASSEPMMVDVISAEKTEIAFLNLSKLFNITNESHPYLNKLMVNLLKVMSTKNLNLSRKINHISSKSIRGRLVSYFTYVSITSGSDEFKIPFNRQQLADYLNVDRSSLSNELSKMRDEGLLEFNKNEFKIINDLDY